MRLRKVKNQEHPSMLLGKDKLINLALSDTIDTYWDEVGII